MVRDEQGSGTRIKRPHEYEHVAVEQAPPLALRNGPNAANPNLNASANATGAVLAGILPTLRADIMGGVDASFARISTQLTDMLAKYDEGVQQQFRFQEFQIRDMAGWLDTLAKSNNLSVVEAWTPP